MARTRKASVNADAIAQGDPDGLTIRQVAFIDHYLGDCRFNGSKAAKAAGYKNREEAYRLISHPIIRARIDNELAAMAATRDEVLEMLRDDALLDVDEMLRQPNIKALDPVTRSSVTSGMVNARTSARQSLAKAYGLFSDRVGAGGGITVEIHGVDLDKL